MQKDILENMLAETASIFAGKAVTAIMNDDGNIVEFWAGRGLSNRKIVGRIKLNAKGVWIASH